MQFLEYIEKKPEMFPCGAFLLCVVDEMFTIIPINLACPGKFQVARLKWRLPVTSCFIFIIFRDRYLNNKRNLLACWNQYTYSRALIWLKEMCQKNKVLRIKFCLIFLKINLSKTVATMSRLNYTYDRNMLVPFRSFISRFWFCPYMVTI